MLVPRLTQVHSIKHLTKDHFLLHLIDPKGNMQCPFQAGQFNMLYLYGVGETAISICGDVSKQEGMVHTIRAVGSVTNGLQKLKLGDEVGMRGPFGSHWPLVKGGHDVVIVAGGVGLPPLRPLILQMCADRTQFGKITLLYGARTPDNFIYHEDLKHWEGCGIEIKQTVDQKAPGWHGAVGVVTHLLPQRFDRPHHTLIYLCGPEIMMRVSIECLKDAGLDPAKVFVSMERNMQCGVAFCGHCQYGPYFLCKDGPVFSYATLKPWWPIHEL